MMKNLSVIKIFIYIVFCSASFSIHAQGNRAPKLSIAQDLPTVFLLGEFDKNYETMMVGQATLLDACDNDMNLAYGKLMGMMKEMEAYASLVDFDLKGINAWMHFFWRADGSIDHIGFYLKPNSRNVGTDMMKNFLEGFAKQYKLPLRSGKKFSHYSSFSFPIVKHEINQDNAKSTAKLNSSKGN
jgi:hypothetical protein